MYKKIVAIIIIAILLVGTGTAFAYWETSNQKVEETLSVGYGISLEVEAEATVPDGKLLVPVGESLRDNDIEEVVLTYNTKTSETITEGLNLDITASNILIGGLSTYSDLVNIDIEQVSSTVNSSDILVTVTVTILEPSTYEIYSQIVNQNITFTLTFEATQTLN